MIDNYIDNITKTQLFSNITVQDMQAMFRCLNPMVRFYNKGEIIIMQDEEVYSIGLILYGGVLVSKDNYDGNRVVISQLRQGEVFGAMVAFSHSSRSLSNIIANESTGILMIPKDKIIKQCSGLCIYHHRLIRNFLEIVSERALELNKKVVLLSIKSIKGKIAAYLLDQSKNYQSDKFEIPINRNQMAEYLNVSRPSLSREMSELKADNIIDYHLNTIRIRDREKLKVYTFSN